MNYPIPAAPAQIEQEVKRSRFICFLQPVRSRDEALTFLAELKHRYPDARHHCWAYVAGPPEGQTQIACSDDGEPQGTAGKPILNVLQHKGLGEIMAVVVRYFGGIKLGAGGLVRAYSGVTQAACDILETRQHIATCTVAIRCGYEFDGLVRQLLPQFDAAIDQIDYGAELNLTCSLPEDQAQALLDTLVERSSARIQCHLCDD